MLSVRHYATDNGFLAGSQRAQLAPMRAIKSAIASLCQAEYTPPAPPRDLQTPGKTFTFTSSVIQEPSHQDTLQ